MEGERESGEGMSSLGRKRSRFGSMSEDEENSNVTDENVW